MQINIGRFGFIPQGSSKRTIREPETSFQAQLSGSLIVRVKNTGCHAGRD
jgi:hypothetical protein